MITKDTGGYVDYLEATTWQQLVAGLLGSDGIEVIGRHSEEIFVGVGTGTRLYRVIGTATDGGRPVEWTIVIKVISLDKMSFQSVSTDQSSWDYWKREWYVYQAPWLQQLPGPLVAPRVLGTGEILAEADKELAWIALEDLQALDRRPWQAGEFREVARHLGMFNGDYLSGRPLPTDPWLSRNWIRGWTELAQPFVELLPTISSHPDAGRLFTPDLIDCLIQLWDEREKLYQVLERLPQTLCHNDVFPRNLFVRGDGRTNRSVAIDWAFCGYGPVGQELSALVGATQPFMESRPERWDELERDCLDGYADGLRKAGWHDSDEVLLGYLVSTVLRFGIGSLAPALGLTLTGEHRDLVTRVFGCSYDEFITNAASVFRFQEQRIHQARALLGM